MMDLEKLGALAVPLIWILIMGIRIAKNRKKKRDYYAAEEKQVRQTGGDNKPIHPKGTSWGS